MVLMIRPGTDPSPSAAYWTSSASTALTGRIMIKLLIVDDSALMRRLLLEIFRAEPDFDIRRAHQRR